MSIRAKIQEESHTSTFRYFTQYFEKILKENREKLDVAEGNEMYKLQGENRALKRLLQLKEKRAIEYASCDGGFGEN